MIGEYIIHKLRRWRDSITGRFVKKEYADAHPDTTAEDNMTYVEEKDTEE